ncbi:hypothetical protein E4T85_20490 [Bacillus stratosphericus]|nr:hypothetical protein E4T85_20490 [Bacillus stratosphericus]
MPKRFSDGLEFYCCSLKNPAVQGQPVSGMMPDRRAGLPKDAGVRRQHQPVFKNTVIPTSEAV